MRAFPATAMRQGRVLTGPYATTHNHGCVGAFFAICPTTNILLRVIASDGDPPEIPWEHVSVSPAHDLERTPTWEEMCWVKDQFWEPHEAVFQLHPPKEEYVNHHPWCLHLWRHITHRMPLPTSELVGPKPNQIILPGSY